MTYDASRDAYESWKYGIATLREMKIRAGTIAPRPDNPQEIRWASEGPIHTAAPSLPALRESGGRSDLTSGRPPV